MKEVFGPRQLILIGCKGTTKILGKSYEISDLIPVTQHVELSENPFLYSIVVNKKVIGCELIKETKAFVVNFMKFSDVKKILSSFKHSGELHDKYKEIGFTKENCEKLIDFYRVKESVAVLECEVINELDVGENILFIGRVLHYFVKHKSKRPFLNSTNELVTTE